MHGNTGLGQIAGWDLGFAGPVAYPRITPIVALKQGRK